MLLKLFQIAQRSIYSITEHYHMAKNMLTALCNSAGVTERKKTFVCFLVYLSLENLLVVIAGSWEKIKEVTRVDGSVL